MVGEVCVGYGADGHASTSGKLGFDFGLNASGGSVQLALPMTVGLNVTPGIRGVSNPVISLPTDGFALEAGGFNYLSAHGIVPVGPPALRSFAPTFSSHLDAVAQLDFSVGGHICYIYCLSGDVSQTLGGSVSLFNVGPIPGGGYTASALGLGNLTLPYEIPLSNVGKLTINVPNVNTDSSVQGGYDPATKTVTSKGRDSIFGLSLDLAAIVGKAFPILDPFFGSHDFGPVGSYNLLSASIGMFLEYAEKFVAKVRDVVVGFVFTDPVSVNGAAASNFVLPTRGEELTIAAAPGAGAGFKSVGVLPVFYIQAGIHHEPSLIPTLQGELKVLQLSVAGHEFGPLVDARFGIDLAQLNLPSFDTVSDYIPIVGMPFNIYPTVLPITEDRCRTEFCSNHEYREVREQCPRGDHGEIPVFCDPSLQRYRMWIVDASCPLSVAAYECPNAFEIGQTSLSSFTNRNLDDLIFTNASSLTFPSGLQGPLLPVDYGSNWLAQNGFTANAPPFPAFAPFLFPFEITASVPEPGTITLLLAGVAAIVISRRRRNTCSVDAIADNRVLYKASPYCLFMISRY